MSNDKDNLKNIINFASNFLREFALFTQQTNNFINQHKSEIEEIRLKFLAMVNEASKHSIKLIEGMRQYDIDFKDYIELTARLGWPPFLDLNIYDIRIILDGLFKKNGGRNCVDIKNYMPSEDDIKYFSKEMVNLFDSNPNYIENMSDLWTKHPFVIGNENLTGMINDIIFSFENKRYYSAVVTMLPIFEIILIKIRDSNDIQKSLSKSKKIDTSKIKDTKIIFEKIFNEDSLITHQKVVDFIEYFFFASEKSRDDSLLVKKKYYEIDFNRHMIVHGEYLNYGRQELAIKGLILLSNMFNCTIFFLSSDEKIHLSSCDGLDLLDGKFISQYFFSENEKKYCDCIKHSPMSMYDIEKSDDSEL